MTILEYLRAEQQKPFVYGYNDCATLAIRWLDAKTGGNGLSAWIGRYDDEASCIAHIAAGGGFQALAQTFIDDHYKLTRAQPASGNVVLASVRGFLMLGLRAGDKFAAFRLEKRGLITLRDFKPVAEWGAACLRS